jgi:cell division septation protein DedD
MQRGIGGTVFEPVEVRQDKEITLGPAMLVVLAGGLFALCGLCFAFGYAVGHRSSGDSVISGSLPAVGNPLVAQAASGAKPSAGQSSAQPKPVENADGSAPSITDEAEAQTDQSTSGATSASTARAVQSALPNQAVVAQPVAGNGASVASALPQSQVLMVQIAAVSHPEDADVLVGALRKRGYAVTARRDPMDGLLHVQVGPFANRSDALAMRQKLLNDGYNAIVQ